MNRIYRSIWNQATGAYAAVSENVKSAGKRSMPGCSGGGAHFALTSMAAALMLGYGSLALAGPAGGTVVAGQATINGAPGSTVIKQGSQNAVINWANFNINKGESVQFVQPNSNAVALNRVLGSDGTTILGNLSANGKVFIVNPNGVLFGQGASVNTAGLVASTLDINNADFMSGKYQFSGNGSGKVLNQGSISAPGGYVALLGANVSNEGTIQARLGSVALAAGRAITLDVAGDGLLNVAVNAGAVGALVNNGGMIRADGGSVVLTAQAAGDLLKTVVNNTGVIEAHTIDTRGGTIKLLGDMQSGTVHAGGTLDASAPTGGNGGFVDTSAAHVKIDDALKVTTASNKGLSGTWLIDPTDYTIAASGGDQTGAYFSNALKFGNVQIQSISGGSGTQGNINVNDNVNWSANKLTLTAQNNININKAMRGSGTASLALEYGQSAVAASNPATYNVKAEVDLPSGNNFSTKLGSNGGVTVYQVINSLGAFNSSSGSDVQGMQGNLSGNYVLGSNIDASVTGSWDSGRGFMPIGNAATPFTGKFDGLGHELYGLTINRAETPAAMFGNIGLAGIVRNLSLSNVTITGSQAVSGATYTDVGALAGYNAGTINNVSSSGAVHGAGYVNMGALVGTNAGTVSNSRAAGTVLATAYGAAGGLVGLNTAGGLIKSSSSAVAATSTSYFAGGLAVLNYGTISDSYATGAVSVGSTGGSYGGGLAAINHYNGVVKNSYATGNVTGTSGLGGLLGRIESGGTVDNSYATGNVTGSGNNIGGLVGLSYGPIRNSYATGNVTGNSTVGGVVGYNLSTMTNVYYSGKLTAGGASVGMIVGDNNGGTVTNAYFDKGLNSMLASIGVTGNAATSNALGLTSAQMLQGSNFAGFNFTTTAGAAGNNWVIVSGDGSINGASAGTRPMLASEWSNTINSTHQLQLMAMSKAASYTLDSSFSAASTAANGNDVWGSTGFIPVGTAGSAFTGSLDGTGHIVSNLNIIKSGVAGVGLFGVVGGGGVIANVGLSGGTINGGDNTGALVGTNGGSVSGSFATSAVTGANNVGGLVGSNTGTIKDSYASGAVTGSSGAGGLLGSNSGTVTTSYANGSVSGAGGGLVGTGAGSVTGSYWDTTASGKATSAGGTNLTTSGLKTLSNYTGAGWELGQMWVAYDGQSAPFLRSFMKQIAVRVSYGSKVYDGVAYAGGSNSVTYSNTVAGAGLLGTVAYAANPSGAVNVGSYGVSASGLYATGGQSGYAISYIDGNLMITPKALTVTGVTAASRDYDGTRNAVLSGGALNGLVSGETLNLDLTNQTGVFADKNAGSGKVVTVTGATISDGTTGLASNYTFSNTSGVTANITPKALTVTDVTAANRAYDGTRNAVLSGGALSGLVSGETLNLNLTNQTGVFADKNAGSGKVVSVTGATISDGTTGLASNYAISNASGVTANISKATINSVSNVGVNNKTYDGSATATLTGTATFSGIIGADSLTVAGNGEFSDKNAGTGKTVDVSGLTLGGADVGNYALASTISSGVADIMQKALTVTGVTAASRDYDGTRNAVLSGGALSGLVSGDTLNLELTNKTGVFADKNAGSGKVVTVTGATISDGTTGLASNYAFTNASGVTANISKATINSVSNVGVNNKTYDGLRTATLNGSAVFDGKMNGDSLTVAGSGVFNDKNAGTGKTVNVSNIILGGADADNYILGSTLSSGVADVAKASISSVSNVGVNNKTYDGLRTATLNGSAVFDGKMNGDSLTVAGSGVFNDKNAGTGKTVNVSNIILGGADAGNYVLASTTSSGVADIAKASIGSVSNVGVNDKTYDGLRTATLKGTASFDGIIGNDGLSVAGSGLFSDKNAGTAKVVTVSGITLAGADAGNYILGSNVSSGTADITPKALTVAGQVAGNKVYDGNAVAQLFGGSLAGLVGDETLSFAGQTAAFNDKNAGNAKAVTVSGTTLLDGSGAASNYTVSNPTGLTASITPKTLTVTGQVAGNKVYDGNVVAQLLGGSLVGLVGSETLFIAGQTAVYSDKNVANTKTVTVSGTTLLDGTGSASNYTVVNPTGLTASITPKALTVAGQVAGNKVYDGNAVAQLLGGSLLGLVGDETLAIAGQTAAFGDKNVANAKAVTVSGTTLLDGSGAASNYTVSNPTGLTASITPKALTVAGQVAGNKVYDGNAVAQLFGGSLLGLVGSETLSIGGQTAAFSDKNAANAKTVTVSGTSLLDAGSGTTAGSASNY